MASNEFINECKNNAYKNRLGTISIKDITKKSGSVITTDEAIEGPLNDYKIYGNTYQNSTSGNQLLDFKNYNLKSDPITNFSFENNILSLNQTVAGTYTRVSYNILDYVTTNPGKKINFSYKSLDVTNFNSSSATLVQLAINNNGTTRYHTLLNKNGKTTAYTIPSDTTGITVAQVNIYTNNTSTAIANSSVSITEPLLYFNDNSEYEPYTEGQPSPNPDYPQEIISCGDKSKNLYNPKDINTFTYSGITLTRNTDDSYTIDGTSTSSTSATRDFTLSNPITLKSGESVTFSKDNALNEYLGGLAFRSNNNTLFILNTHALKYTYTATSDITIDTIRTFYIANSTYDNYTFKLFIARGSNPTNEPYYDGYKIPVNVRSDNLATNLEFAWYSSVSQKFTTSYNFKRCTAKIKPNTTYTITKKNASNRFVVITSEVEIAPTVPYKRTVLIETNTNRTRYTFTTQADENYLFFGYYSGTDETEIELAEAEIMIVEGSTAPSKYIPYYNETTNIYLDEPLRKTKDGTYVDYIDFINQKVYRQLGGTEISDYSSFSHNGNFAKNVQFTTTAINNLKLNIVNSAESSNLIFCNYMSSFGGTTASSSKIRVNIPYEYLGTTSSSTAQEAKRALINLMSGKTMEFVYPLETPIEENIELPNINLIEGKNIITIGTELESIIEIEYTNWENKIKNSDRLQNITIDNGCIVNNEIIGSVYSKKITSNILDSNELELEDKRINTQIGVKYDDDSIEMINMGECTVERPKDEQTANMGQIIAYDDLNSKLEDKYICGIDYQQGNKTLKDLYIDLCSQLGLTPKNLNFDNNTIPIIDNPFTNGEKNRLVLQTIEKVSGTFSDIDNNTNEIDLCWLSNSVEPDYTFYRNDYTNLEGGKIVYGPINCLVIKNSQIDDENVTIKDDESITLNGEHTLTINEDYILYNSELRQLAIDTIWNKVHNLTYVDCKLTTLYGKPFLKLGDKIRVYKTDTEYFDTYVLLHQFTYDGSFESIIQSPALTEQEIKTKQKKSLGEALKNTEVEVNKQKQTITALVQETSENTEKTSQLQLQSDEINQRIEDSQYYIDENGNKKTISGSINELKSTAEELNLNLQKIGGLNLMKNSSGQNGTIGYKSKMLKPYVEFQTWTEFDNYISLGSKVYQIYTCFIHVVGETTDSERDCWYGLYYTEGFSKSYYFEQVVRNGNFIYPDKYNKYMDILYDNLFMFVEQNYTNSSSFKTFLEKYTDEYTNITPNIFTSISNDIIENNTISKSAFLLTPTVRDMYTTMNEDRIYGESFTMPKNTNKLYFSVKSKIDGLCGRARLIMYQLNDKMENIQNNLNVYDSYENHIVNANFINIPDNILNNDNFIEYKVEMEISDRCVEILPCFSIGNNFVNDGPYVNFVNPILNPITRFYWKKVWETIDEVSAYYTYRSTHIKKKLQFFENATLPEISDTPDFTQLWLCTDEIEGYTKDTLYTPQYEIDSNGEIISRTWIQTDYTKEQIERGIEITMFDNWTYVYSAGAVESATPRPDMKFIIADCMVSATDTSWQPASGENYWGKNIKISGDKGIYIYNTVDGYNRIIDEKQDIAKDKNGNTTWELTGKGMKTKRAECESIRLPKLEILCTNDSTAFYCKENEDDDYGA